MAPRPHLVTLRNILRGASDARAPGTIASPLPQRRRKSLRRPPIGARTASSRVGGEGKMRRAPLDASLPLRLALDDAAQTDRPRPVLGFISRSRSHPGAPALAGLARSSAGSDTKSLISRKIPGFSVRRWRHPRNCRRGTEEIGTFLPCHYQRGFAYLVDIDLNARGERAGHSEVHSGFRRDVRTESGQRFSKALRAMSASAE